MINIILYGNLQDKKIFNCLKKNFAKQFSCSFLNDQYIDMRDSQADFLIYETDHPLDILNEHTIVVFKDSGAFDVRPCKNRQHVSIINSENNWAIDFIKENELNTITCGLSLKDIVSVSSYTGESTVVALQRSIRSLMGTMIEPVEIPIRRISNADLYSILVLNAILLLSEKQGSVEKMDF
ncbi:hypothetical protein [Candidatus Soleaferrea massiliensis]|uniref:hypothetical protein n=1 Tax=Candidatus Soleaferrea massiliensis TaxID=1470354 RepID=UPI00058B33E0|nr:hypothetical protein [Candidatus Soleaferrea massiliensis]